MSLLVSRRESGFVKFVSFFTVSVVEKSILRETNAECVDDESNGNKGGNEQSRENPFKIWVWGAVTLTVEFVE